MNRITFFCFALAVHFHVGAQSWYNNYQRLTKVDERLTLLQSIIDRGHTCKQEHILLAYLLKGDNEVQVGNLEQAEESYLKAKSLTEEFAPLRKSVYLTSRIKNPLTIFDIYDRLGNLYIKSGNIKEGKAELYNSIKIRERWLPKNSVHHVQPYINLATIYFHTGEQDSAAFMVDGAVKRFKKSTTNAINLSFIERDLYWISAEIFIKTKEFDKARRSIERVAITTFGFYKYGSSSAKNQERARVLDIKARYYYTKGDIDLADYYIKKANLLDNDSISFSSVNFGLLRTNALVAWSKQDFMEARKYFNRLLKAYNQYLQINLSVMTDQEREDFYTDFRRNVDLINYFYAYCIQNKTLEGVEEDLYNNAIKTKAMLLSEAAMFTKSLREDNSQELSALVSQWQQARQALAANSFVKGNEKTLVSLERQINDIEKQLGKMRGAFGQHEDTLTWKDIRNTLNKDEAALEIVRIIKQPEILNVTDNNDSIYYVAVTVNQQSVHPVCNIIPDGRALEGRLYRYYTNVIRSQLKDTISYEKYWRETGLTDNIRRVYISSDGVYNLINLNTLYNKVKDKYLIDEFEIVNVTNTRDLAITQKPLFLQTASLFGYPDFGLKKEGVGQSTKRGLVSEELQKIKENEFEDLPATKDEIKAIEDELIRLGYEVNSFLEEKATERNIKSIISPEILHIATHGYFINSFSGKQSDALLKSGLIFSGVNQYSADVTDDGVLTAYEATSLNLSNTQLVVLSACETGLGDVKAGEGVYGLQRAFMVAGAKNVIMSVWKVDDRVTSELMVAFYEANAETKSITKAFRQAQLIIRERYPDPYYWGGFKLLTND